MLPLNVINTLKEIEYSVKTNDVEHIKAIPINIEQNSLFLVICLNKNPEIRIITLKDKKGEPLNAILQVFDSKMEYIGFTVDDITEELMLRFSTYFAK